jgi:hypothetical protein
MVACPVCEHEQDEGAECEVCGKVLVGAAQPDAATALLQGLEPTALEYVADGDPEPLPGLERSDTGVVQFSAQVASPDWLEPTRHELPPEPLETAVAPQPVEAVEAVEIESLLSQLAGGDAPSLRPRCRYCRTEWSPGEAFCKRCGMKVSVVRPEASEVERPQCPQCGRLAEGAVCRACGARLAAKEG